MEHGRDDFDVLGPSARDVDLAARHGRDDRPTPRLDVIAPQPARAPAQPSTALDANGRRPGAADADPELLQELA